MTVHKVTTFITRTGPAGQPQLLLFQHPQAGVQIPAGTVEVGEDWQTAALREATEETGLIQLTFCHYLGQIENELAPDEMILNRDSQILSQPDALSIPFHPVFTRGHTFQVGAVNGRFRQITYLEYDQLPNPQAITLYINGWLPQERLSRHKTRHYVHLLCQENTPDRWSLPGDNNHLFAPFWADLQPKPGVVSPQDRWLDDVYHHLLRKCRAIL
jgi:8-oxo-dGTP pyrophosphatase MutT (NUDIX family)